MIFIFILFMFISPGQSQNDTKLDDFDSIAAKLLAYGDKNSTFPANNNEASDLCTRYNESESVASNLIHPFFYRYNVTRMAQFTAATVCQLYKDFPNNMSQFASEVNSKTDSMSDLFKKMNNFATYTGEGIAGQVFCSNFSLMACYFRTWVKEVNDLLTEPSQIINNKIFRFYLDFGAYFEYLANCSWSDIPRASYVRYRSINLNFVIGTMNCFAYKTP